MTKNERAFVNFVGAFITFIVALVIVVLWLRAARAAPVRIAGETDPGAYPELTFDLFGEADRIEIQTAPAFAHPYQWTDAGSVDPVSCTSVAAAPQVPAHTHCLWTGPVPPVGVYRWHRARACVGPTCNSWVIEPGRIEAYVDPLP